MELLLSIWPANREKAVSFGNKVLAATKVIRATAQVSFWNYQPEL
jgi:hypothetical protein